MKAKNVLNGQFIIFSIFMLILVILPGIVVLLTDYMWFEALGYLTIFITEFWTRVKIFIFVFAVFFAFSFINIYISSRIKKSKYFKVEMMLSFVASIFAGIIASNNWLLILSYFNKVDFGIVDPIFTKDVSFYVFTLPFYAFVWKILIGTFVFVFILVALHYFESLIRSYFKGQQYSIDPNTGARINSSFNPKSEIEKIKNQAKGHLAVIGSFIFLLLAFGNYLVKYALMFSKQGIVVGAGYVDVNIVLPLINFLMIFALFITLFFYLWIFYLSKKPKLKKKRYLLTLIGVYFAMSILIVPLAATVFQGLIVDPNELNLEKQYLDNNIKFTQKAYGVDDIEESFFNVSLLTKETVEREKDTINNARILDYRPLEKTYKQTQEIRLYYDLSRIDIDRYEIEGEYKQVMLAARELNQDKLSENAKKWINLHLTYTHGMGIVMSPVNKVTKEGLPDYYIKDIPPIYTVNESNIMLDEPRIYYGEIDNSFIITGTSAEEFDYSKGDLNQYIKYNGTGGVEIDSLFKRFLFAIRFGDLNILISPTLTKDSMIMYNRQIQERIAQITPFLELDKDPYVVISEGKIYWIQDAYTISGNYPYSEKFGEINYIRNSAKIVVDAYNGDVEYYIKEDDPIIQTYSKIFEGQFKSLEDMPPGLRKNTRYPVDMFQVQSQIFAQYHMEDTTVFYNKEDAWEIPNEVYGVGNQIQVEPYYIITKLPGEKEKEFILMTPFTPRKKDNMISWFAARSDGEHYGKLVLYKFPKDRLVYGPLQVEAKIDQDSEISQQITLWSQQGSQVTRGNLIIIPLENSLIYIEPLYIQSELGQLPELKRVLVSDGERVVMEQTIEKAIQSLFDLKSFNINEQKKQSNSPTGEIDFIIADSKTEELIEKAGEYYSKVQDSMKGQNWTGIGDNLNKLGEVLEELNK